MRYRKKGDVRSALLSSVASVMAVTAVSALAPTAFAQDQSTDAAEDEAIEQVVVTGSRIRRDSFSSAAPIQILNTDDARQIGVSSITELLQRAVVANGQQIDATLNTNAGNSNATEAPPTGGIGSSNIDLRGLGPERTLVLVNGRRLGSAGVRGAPAQPDLSLLPFSVVERVEIITEGASSIYGADAVAGVVNIILRDDFEGLELTTNLEFPGAGGGEIKQFSFATGASGERGKFMMAGEFFSRKRVLTKDRSFSSCLQRFNVEADPATGKEVPGGAQFQICQSGFFDNVIFASGDPASPDEVFFYYTPGITDIGIPNFSTCANIPAVPAPFVDACSTRRFIFNDFFNDQDERRNADLIQPISRFSIIGTGSYLLDEDTNMEVYEEFYYFDRSAKNFAATEQIFPTIPGMIPQEDANGNIIVDANGAPILVDNPLNPFGVDAVPILTLEDIPQFRTVDLQQIRFVGGLRGDAPIEALADKNWTYDMFFSYDKGEGAQDQPVFFEPNVILATQTVRLDANGNLKCGVNGSDLFGFVTPPACVPLDLFNASVFTGGKIGEGVFATPEERDFLLAQRVNTTTVEQFNAAAFATGDLFDIEGGGTVAMAFGAEFRKDVIHSRTDITGEKGNNAAENPLQEGPTIGGRWIYDLYAEVNVPLIVGRENVDLFALEGAARFTEEENFGSEWTFRARFVYRPNDRMQLSGSYGTSFRAPNLREQFLASQGGGIGGGNDLCVVPRTAFVNGVYQRGLDGRSDRLLNNCILQGADPTQLGFNAVVTIPITVGGSNDLVAEESRSYTATISYSFPTDQYGFSFDVAASYYDIRITDTVEELDAAVIIRRCLNDEDNLGSQFCNRIQRGTSAGPSQAFINLVDASFVNVGLETARGIDINTRFFKSFDDFIGAPLDFAWSTSTAYAIDNEVQVFSDSRRDDNVGEIGSPVWRVTSTVSGRWKDFELLWNARYIDNTGNLDLLDLADQGLSLFDSSIDPGAITTVQKNAVKDRLYHDISLTWRLETAAITVGVNNLLDKAPPIIGSSAGPNRNNAVTSSGFDLFGRTFFANITKAF